MTKDILDQSLKVVFLIFIGFTLGFLLLGQIINHDMKSCAEAYTEVRNAYIECEMLKNTEDWYNASYRFGEFWNSTGTD